MQCLKFSFPSQPSSRLRNSKVSSLPIYSTKKSYFPVENRWSTFRTFALPERWETQNDCRALALLSSAHAPPCSFSPGASVHSITHILWEQVSQRSQKFKPVSSHLAAGNISKSDLTTEVWAGKGSSAAPSTYQWLPPVSSQHHLSLSPIRRSATTAQIDFALSLSLLLPSAPWQSWKNQDRTGDDLCNTSTAFATCCTSINCSGKQPHVLVRELTILICVVQPSQFPILFPLSQTARHFYKFVSAFITLLLSLFAYVAD